MIEKENVHHLHIVLTPEQYHLLSNNAKRGLCLLDQVYGLMYQIARK